MNLKNLIPSKKIKVVPSSREQERDLTALDSLLEKYSKPLWGYLHKNLPMLPYQDRQDIIQDTWIRALDALRKRRYQAQGKFFPWLCTIAHNLSINCIRKNKITVEISTLDNLEEHKIYARFSTAHALDMLIQKEQRALLDECMQRLPSREKETLRLRLYEGMTYKEIGHTLNINPRTAYVHGINGLKMLMKTYSQYLRNNA